jgi:hypothetical protein
MKQYDVTITARVTKTYRVTAEGEEQAYEAAHDVFSVLPDHGREYYEQETLDIEEIEEEA